MNKETDLADVVATIVGAFIGLVVVSIVVIPIGLAVLALDAWVGTYLWQWFVMPTFHLPLLTLPAAMGVIITWRLFRGQISSYDKPAADFTPAEKKAQFGKVISALLSPFCVLGLGWIIHHFWML